MDVRAVRFGVLAPGPCSKTSMEKAFHGKSCREKGALDQKKKKTRGYEEEK